MQADALRLYRDALALYRDVLRLYRDALALYRDVLRLYRDALALYRDVLRLYRDALALYRDALTLQGIAKFNSLQINELLYLARVSLNVMQNFYLHYLAHKPL
ncbi:hypothetical protein [Nostoc sp. 'Lobaria pulmonaria (5183) cyanobiont']|uniref:hypothetical protein n=1 Tax=Nostoc sp. 'Lobaria pulmonaria (5183) cyanobiont' TaxID=1618022 RepID=UPI001319E344|nr:hypothetical protein [Nostoc sp. 'Lobaria pulmonaria (5183) cyanobiont']